jgi:DNA invertase Pin-like site-specific DNA recombinase
MTVLAYIRIDAHDALTQKRAMVTMVREFALSLGLPEPAPHDTHFDSCTPLTPPSQREVGPQLARMLKSGDVLIVPHFSSLFSVASEAGPFLRLMNGRSVPVYVAELGLDVTTMLPILSVIFQAYAHWESALIRAEQDLAREQEYHAAMLTDFGSLAMEKVGERIAKADLASAIKEAVHESAQSASSKRAGEKKRTLDLLTPEGKAKLKRTNPEIFDRLNGAVGE